MQVLASAMAQSTPCSVAFITHSAHQVGISFQQPSSCFSRHDHNLAPYTRGLLPRRMDAMETSSSLLDGIPVSEESIEMALIQRFGRLKGLASRIPSSPYFPRAGNALHLARTRRSELPGCFVPPSHAEAAHWRIRRVWRNKRRGGGVT